MHHDLREQHPTPQFVREEWTDLCGTWQFVHDDANAGMNERWYERDDVFPLEITVPYPPESRASGVHAPEPHPVVWYRRTFRVDDATASDTSRQILHFNAVDYDAHVWVNGQLVAHHRGGQTPFQADITNALLPGAIDQVIVVRAQDDPLDLEMPRGKQDWQAAPHGIWYHRTTGIWQPVWLERVHATHIASLRLTPAVDRGALGCDVTVAGAISPGLTLQIRVSLGDRVFVDDTVRLTSPTIDREFIPAPGGFAAMTDHYLWSPERPTLLDVELTLRDGDEVIDSVLSYTGLRSVDTLGGHFRLNQRATFLRLVLEQGYWPVTHLAAPDGDALRHEVELIKALGFNGARIHQKVEDPRFLYWCDRLGLMVWGEMANAYHFSRDAAERLLNEWADVVQRDYNHPSIVCWVPLNESWGVPSLQRSPQQQHYLKTLYHLTHTLDTTRPVITNDGWEHVASDVLGIHDYSFYGDAMRERYKDAAALEHTVTTVSPGQHPTVLPEMAFAHLPAMITEYGGISLAPDKGAKWFGYGTVTSIEEYVEKFAELTGAILDSPTLSGLCYTQLTDTEQETNGLLTADRTPKIDPETISDILNRPAASIPREQTMLHRKRAAQRQSR